MAANTDTIDRRTAKTSDQGEFVGQIRQRGYCRQKVAEGSTCWTELIPHFEQWDGHTWRVVTVPDE